jgi:hypothetical protein
MKKYYFLIAVIILISTISKAQTDSIPNNYPSDVPQPNNSKCLGSLTSEYGTVVTFESTDKVIDIVHFYKSEMKKSGYILPEDGEILANNEAAMLIWKKSEKEVSIVISRDVQESKSQMTITYK